MLYERAPDGEIRSIWRCEDFAEATGERSYCGTNTVWWDAETDYLVSIFSYETVVEVDRQTGATLRHFGPPAAAGTGHHLSVSLAARRALPGERKPPGLQPEQRQQPGVRGA